MTRLSDDDLHAYLDGELDPARTIEVEAWLEAEPQEAERLRRWSDQKEGLHRLFDPVLDEPVPPRLSLAAVKSGRRAPLAGVLRLAAALALVLAGGAGGWWLRGDGQGDGRPLATAMAAEAVSAHVVFAAEVRHPVEVAVSDKAHLVGWLSKRLGAPLKVPDLSSGGFTLMGGRLLPASESSAAAQFMYESASGQRLTLYLRRSGGGETTAFRFANQNGVEAFTWMDGPFGYALVADMPRDRLLPLAQAVYHQLEK
ncbi:hypothetical protein A6A04_10775 [Paramagnetospirillum marisnigri]|uniref:Anti-sigma factor n=1 Tax=Paramagnetospirillum marisnigri TaxID=1285242 RepID=A0A178N0D0_9PROT|nr:anti-sigma factor [Paramagnetospirillum marisnigri]OAN56030.1 hypothetical protein A6A04_10775 [Paramagnetospirillum marisnigri]